MLRRNLARRSLGDHRGVRRVLALQAGAVRHVVADHVKDGLATLEMVWRRFAPDRRREGGALRILMVDDLLPDPLLGAGYPRADAIVRSLVGTGHHIDFYPMASAPQDVARMDRAFDGAVRFFPGRGAPGLRRLLRARGDTYDVLFISRPAPMRSFGDSGWRPRRGRVIYDAEAVLAPREARQRALHAVAWSEAEYAAALDAELRLARDVDAVTAVSAGDAALIASALDVPVEVLAHLVEAQAQPAPFADRCDFLFVGRLTGTAAQSANVDSLVWFLTHVRPELDALIGSDWSLHVAGLVDAPELAALAGPRVIMHGVVEDLRPLYAGCRVFIAPTRFAAGIPLKVTEAMGQGVPCVATPLLGEQLGVEPSVLPTGASAGDFAEQCGRLYRDSGAWQDVRDAALSHVARRYSQAAFSEALTVALSRVARPDSKRAKEKRG